MKKALFFLFACIIAFYAKAQKVEVTTSGDAIVTTVYEMSMDDVMKEWKSMIRKYDGKNEMTGSKIVSKSATIKSMSDGFFDITATVEELKKGEIKLVVLFDPLASSTIKTPEKAIYLTEAKRIVKDFAVNQSKDGIEALLKAEQKLLNKQKDQQEDLIRRKEKLENEILDCKDKIKKDEEEIKQNLEQQKTKTTEMETQGKLVEAVKKRLSGVE